MRVASSEVPHFTLRCDTLTLCTAYRECTLFQCDDPTVHHCSANQYRCPLSNHCVESADALDTCPGIKGTHLDHTLSIDERLTYLKNAVTMEEAIGQLTNMAPPIERLGIPGTPLAVLPCPRPACSLPGSLV